MNGLLKESIIPYQGIKSLKLGMTLSEVRAYLKQNKIPFNQTMDSNKNCTPPIPWVYITIDSSLSLSFVKDILFEMSFEANCTGRLPNGIGIGDDMKKLEALEPNLEFDDDDECFVSENGYWIIDDIDSGKIQTITIFLKEVDSDNFFDYEWTEKYLN